MINEGTSDNNPDSHLAEELDALLRRLGSESTAVISGVFSNWQELVGDTVAQHASPIKLESGRLLVEVDEPAWATQMRFLESEIIRKLSVSTGNTINGIDVRVKRVPRTI
ncbi:MAG: DciA family protein [Ilumatobacteraceae bacterium]